MRHRLHVNERMLGRREFRDELRNIAEWRCTRHFLQAKPQGTEELAEWFLRIALPDDFALPAGFQLQRQPFGELRRKLHFIAAERNEMNQITEALFQSLNRGLAIFHQSIARGGNGHEGIAVPVAANP